MAAVRFVVSLSSASVIRILSAASGSLRIGGLPCGRIPPEWLAPECTAKPRSLHWRLGRGAGRIRERDERWEPASVGGESEVVRVPEARGGFAAPEVDPPSIR